MRAAPQSELQSRGPLWPLDSERGYPPTMKLPQGNVVLYVEIWFGGHTFSVTAGVSVYTFREALFFVSHFER